MPRISLTWEGYGLQRFSNQIGELEHRFPKVLPRIVNQVGDRAKTQVIRNLTKQTGLPRKTIVKAIGRPYRAYAGNLRYDMSTTGGNIRLKYFGAKETEDGVVANPFGKRTLFPGAFMTAGRWPNRKQVPKWKGQVMVRTKGRAYKYARSGVEIPTEMVDGATRAAFIMVGRTLLQPRVEAALNKLLR